MKKVLLVATVQSHICQFHRPLVEVLREDKWVIHVAAKNNLEEKNGLKLDFVDKVYDVPFSRSPFKVGNLNAYRQLKDIINNDSYDVIHCNTPVGGILARLAAREARKKRTKVYYTAHGFHFYKGAPILNWLIYYPIEKMFARYTDKLITIVSEDYNFALKKFKCPVHRIHGVGVSEKKFYPIDRGEQLELRKQLNLELDKKIILCVGELLPNKNQEMIIRAMQDILNKNPNIILLIAGNGPKKLELESLIKSLELQNNIIMLGYVTNIHEYQKASDLLVSCSFREGLPLNVIEAMMSGKPIVLTDNRGHRELVSNEKNRCLVASDDVGEMVNNILEILGTKEVYEDISKNVLDISMPYSAEKVKNELKSIYEI